MTNILGLDTSKYEDDPNDPRQVDWNKAKANGVKFVIMRATLGMYYKDTIYQEHKARLAGILPRGSYHYLRTNGTPSDQAKFYYDFAGKLELPPCLDVEDYSYHELPRGEALFNLIQKTLGYIDQNFNQKCMLYMGPDTIKNYLGYEWAKKLIDRKLWVAHYGVNSPDITPWSKYTIWQWSDRAETSQYGISEAKGVDVNYYNGTIEDFNKEFGLDTSGSTVITDPIVISDNTLPTYKINFTMNVRDLPSLMGNKVGSLPAGQIITIKDVDGKDVWMQINDGIFKDKWVAFNVNGTKYLNKEE